MRRLALTILVLVSGCDLVAGIDHRTRAEEDPSTSSSTAGGSGGGGPMCPTIHVSPVGDDANPGCDPTHPKRTIADAIEEARTSDGVERIEICAGVYDEPGLVLDVPVDLLGAWDCAMWTQTATYGYPSFDAANETVIGGTQAPEALRVTGSSVGPGVLLDGLTIRGAAEGDQGGAAIRIEETASPEITNCHAVGGGTQQIAADGSIGMLVTSGAKPHVHHDLLDGGTGITFAIGGVGRAGLVVEQAGPSIHDNRITGGDAEQPEPSDVIASVGVVLRDANALTVDAGRPLAHNTIEGGQGNGKSDGIASAGLLLVGDTDVDVVDNFIRPGDSPGVAVELRGVQSQSTGALRFLGNRIYGGDVSHPAFPWQGFRVGVWMVGSIEPLFENNMIYGGVAQAGFHDGSPSFALSLDNVHGAKIVHNTLYSGPSGYPTVGTALKTYANVTGMLVQNNILAVDGGWNEPIYAEQCVSSGIFASFQNNLLLNTHDPSNPDSIDNMLGYGGDPQGFCQAWQGIDTVDDLVAHLVAAGVASHQGNVTLRAACGADSGCIPWAGCDATNSLDCLQSVFDGWSQNANGLDTLLDTGWRLSPGVPCAIARSSLDLTDSVATDLFGNARTFPVSMGAHELDGACAP
jgi:hypothetical protein